MTSEKEDVSAPEPVEPLAPEEKKSVRWSDIVQTPPSAAPAEKKVLPKTPQPSKSQIKKADVVVAAKPPPRKKSIDRNSPVSQPREEPYTGQEWKSFCGIENHNCVYTFRDRSSAVNVDGKPIPQDQDPADKKWSAENLDTVRFDCGQIYDNQLYVRGWNAELVNWETVRERLWDELSDYQLDIHQIFVNSNGFGFITFANHEVATKCQRLLLDLPSFYGDRLLVNFATVRK